MDPSALATSRITRYAVGQSWPPPPCAVGPEQGDQAGVLEQLDFGVRGGARAVTLDRVGGEDGGDLRGALDPALRAFGCGPGGPVGRSDGAHIKSPWMVG